MRGILGAVFFGITVSWNIDSAVEFIHRGWYHIASANIAVGILSLIEYVLIRLEMREPPCK